eukprot:TRINITY_DN33979_c0_g1_i1.p1 TRINITY_DN33979_c0_g1~~TRINITY_DN33979_c0_g1_i1.p1  ORF type:complete len:116 (-),score=19.63 TRINITY_DN33979_c0_g1_i1:33-380(-)
MPLFHSLSLLLNTSFSFSLLHHLLEKNYLDILKEGVESSSSSPHLHLLHLLVHSLARPISSQDPIFGTFASGKNGSHFLSDFDLEMSQGDSFVVILNRSLAFSWILVFRVITWGF